MRGLVQITCMWQGMTKIMSLASDSRQILQMLLVCPTYWSTPLSAGARSKYYEFKTLCPFCANLHPLQISRSRPILQDAAPFSLQLHECLHSLRPHLLPF